MQKKLFLLVGALILASLGVYLVTEEADIHEHPKAQNQTSKESFAGKADEVITITAQQDFSSAELAGAHKVTANEQGLELRVTGISYTNEQALRIAIIEYANEKHEYSVDDMISGTDAVIKDILPDSVLVEHNGIVSQFRLSLASSAETTYTHEPETEAAPSEVESEIGNRPRELGHIVAVPADYVPGTRLFASPGLNPKLFKNAGLQEGDEIVAINDMDFSLAELFDDIQDEIKSAHTLKFEVLRGGRKVIIYLDIPSETPKIK